MTVQLASQLSLARNWVRGAQKEPKGAQNDQKLGKYVPKLRLLRESILDFPQYRLWGHIQ